MRVTEAQVLQCAVRWWASKRPPHHTVRDHIAGATVNVTGEFECELARAVAELVKKNLQRRKKRARK